MSLPIFSRQNRNEQVSQPDLSFEEAVEVRAVTAYTDLAVAGGLRGLQSLSVYTVRTGNVATQSYAINPDSAQVATTAPVQQPLLNREPVSTTTSLDRTYEWLGYPSETTTTGPISQNVESQSSETEQVLSEGNTVTEGDQPMSVDAIRRFVEQQYVRNGDV